MRVLAGWQQLQANTTLIAQTHPAAVKTIQVLQHVEGDTEALVMHVQLCKHVHVLRKERRRMLLRKFLQERDRPAQTTIVLA